MPESPFLGVVQIDSFGGMRLGVGSMPMGAPSGRGPPFYGGGQVPMPETPLLDSSRKRMREHYYPASEHSMPQHVRTSPQRSCCACWILLDECGQKLHRKLALFWGASRAI